MNIGDWVQRERRGVPHYVESIVAGDVVTRCGKRMRDEPTKTGGKLTLSSPTFVSCKVCEDGIDRRILEASSELHMEVSTPL